MKRTFFFCFIILLQIGFQACKYDKAEPDYTVKGYPQEIGKIITTKCAVTGCHDDVSKEAAAGLSLENWDKMMDGSRGGAVVIPYRPDYSTFLYCINTFDDLGLDSNSDGKILYINLENMTLIQTYTNFIFPYGATINQNQDTIYVTALRGNFIYKIPINDPANFSTIILDGSSTVNTTNAIGPSSIVFSNDNSTYYVTCQISNEVRVMQASNDSLIAVIPTGQFPVEMALSSTMPYLFVSCMEDKTIDPNVRGQVAVINTNTNTIIKYIYTGHQPHALAINNSTGKVYVANRNVSNDGPHSHHTSVCGGKNGYITIIDINTLMLVPGFKTEVSVDPYGMAITH